MKDLSNNYDKFSDRDIVAGILNRDKRITYFYLYKKCYPLFNAVFKKYYTDCNSCVEFINEIYILIMTPNKDTKTSKLEGFGFRCTLTMWLKIVSENYCHHLFAKKIYFSEEISDNSDRFLDKDTSLEDMNIQSLNMEDVQRVLDMMPNERYRCLIHLRYLDEKTNEETAAALDMSMDNYYNKHRLAKAQFKAMLRKEGLI